MNLEQLKGILELLSSAESQPTGLENHYVGRRVICRCRDAGVHMGTLVRASGDQCELADGYRLWKWEGGGLSLSAVAENGIKGGRLNAEKSIIVLGVCEYIPVSDKAWSSFASFVEDAG